MKLTNTVAKAIRTVVQVLASGGFLAGINAAVNSTGHYLPGNAKVAILGVLTPFIALAHNALEDHGIIGTWLRRPSLTPATVQKQTDKAAAAARSETDRLAIEATKLAPAAAPIIDQFKTLLDEALGQVQTRIDGIAAQLPQATASDSTPANQAAPATVTVTGDPAALIQPTNTAPPAAPTA